MSRLAEALRDPIPLAPNRVRRFYRGGRLLDTFRGAPEPADGDQPEDWVGSATRAWTPAGAPAAAIGPSEVELNGERLTLAEVLRREPQALAGATLVTRAGPTLGVLVKLLDAAQRLPVHCHPSRFDAAALLGSRFGKTEAWLILGTRDSGSARVWAGFREPVERADLRSWIERQETDALLAALAELSVQAGDVLLIRAGVPHAIGAGVFLLELQEPTDFSVVAETRGFPIDPHDASLGLGWDRAVDLFDTRPPAALRQEQVALSESVTRLLGRAADPFFRALRVRVESEASAAPPFEPTYAVGVVLAGRGAVEGESRRLELVTGTTFALPAAAVPNARLSTDASLELIWCLGPEPGALDD
ncbi:MAG: class I mannose-6-phosphate isomerase [Chloroflexota bacterium]|nr:class I mannose-6-phosphate isomerase [Chloroflexota bacterium]